MPLNRDRVAEIANEQIQLVQKTQRRGLSDSEKKAIHKEHQRLAGRVEQRQNNKKR